LEQRRETHGKSVIKHHKKEFEISSVANRRYMINGKHFELRKEKVKEMKK
jgi:hypothetical protein